MTYNPDYQMINSPAQEKFWRWVFDLDTREEKYLTEHPEKRETKREDWICPEDHQVLSASNKALLDHTIFTHIQYYHCPSGRNNDITRRRMLKISVLPSGLVSNGWVVWLDNVKIDLFLGEDAQKKASMRAKDFINF
jgi:DNA primase large subunit